ncbi:MAG: hypothetical protein JST00_21855 [Deltaproteobacteria bacterium]|nr:hypothetical protein [Deltaproteobacteria bacterium]
MDDILIRSAAMRLALVFAFVLAMLALSAGRAHGKGDTAHVVGGLYTPSRVDDRLVWRAEWVLDREDAAEIDGGATQTVRFATPLPEGEVLDPAQGLEPIVDGGRLVGVRVGPRALSGRSVRATLRQPVARDAAHGIPLGAPVAGGTAVQIVDGDIGNGLRLEASHVKGMERHVGFTAPTEIGHAARVEARRLTGYDARLTGAPIYVRGEDVRTHGVITADLASSAAQKSRGGIAVGVGFAAAVGALILAMKRLHARATEERADAVLAADIERSLR